MFLVVMDEAAYVDTNLVGKVEQGFLEDDPRNPAIIADLVGDNISDCAVYGADLFESSAAKRLQV